MEMLRLLLFKVDLMSFLLFADKIKDINIKKHVYDSNHLVNVFLSS